MEKKSLCTIQVKWICYFMTRLGECFLPHIKTFTKTGTLRLGVKPYACSMCDMRFYQRYHLERHSLKHTGMSLLYQGEGLDCATS